MSKHLVLALLAAGLLAGAGLTPAADEAPARNRRAVYVVRHGAAKDLADLLGKDFKGDAAVQVLPYAPSNCLLVSAPPGVLDEVVKLLDQLDRRPRLVTVEVFVANMAPRKGETPADKELDERELTGPADQVLAKVEEMRKKRQIESLKRVQLTALENQQAAVMVGGSKPFVMGTTTTATGLSTSSVNYHPVGTSVSLTSHITAEKTVRLELAVEDSRAAFPEDGAEGGPDEKGHPVRLPDFVQAKLNTKLDLPPGQALVAKGVKTTSKSGSQAQTLVIVTARVVEPVAGGEK
jgi:type II secretory pathway component GspD/PulD (secretin)